MKLTKGYTSCDCEFVTLTNDNGKELLSGDYYHEKINYQIQGYLKALRDNGIEYELEEREIICPECGHFSLNI